MSTEWREEQIKGNSMFLALVTVWMVVWFTRIETIRGVHEVVLMEYKEVE